MISYTFLDLAEHYLPGFTRFQINTNNTITASSAWTTEVLTIDLSLFYDEPEHYLQLALDALRKDAA